ncbi:PREDICTED: transmembrane protein 150A-like [Cyprinodon variegatus]|uniref:Si:dkey-228d14.5 n=1 Tax=Cyprinodon variegatus TaxID=28743 RepID=A0A3Q2FVN8_CYPVA|nr:PREDICTED: transmembrane protein 150A-like [Cyprinodon variegatus]
MVLWIILPISLSLVSFIGTWSVYGMAYSNNHVCSLSDWSGANYCRENKTKGCCLAPTISGSGTYAPESSLFTATMNAGTFLFLLFTIFHHAHIMEKHMCHSMLSRIALAFGLVAAIGAFGAGNCNPGDVTFMHYLGAAVSFTSACFYTILLTTLTAKCVLTGFEKFLFPLRIFFTVVQIIVTLGYTFLFVQEEYFYHHLSAVFEWSLSVNIQMFELTYTAEFFFFSSFMVSNLLSQREEEKPLIISMS